MISPISTSKMPFSQILVVRLLCRSGVRQYSAINSDSSLINNGVFFLFIYDSHIGAVGAAGGLNHTYSAILARHSRNY